MELETYKEAYLIAMKTGQKYLLMSITLGSLAVIMAIGKTTGNLSFSMLKFEISMFDAVCFFMISHFGLGFMTAYYITCRDNILDELNSSKELTKAIKKYPYLINTDKFPCIVSLLLPMVLMFFSFHLGIDRASPFWAKLMVTGMIGSPFIVSIIAEIRRKT